MGVQINVHLLMILLSTCSALQMEYNPSSSLVMTRGDVDTLHLTSLLIVITFCT